MLIPYIIVKFERLFTWLQEEDDSAPLSWRRGEGGKKLAKFVIFKLHPYITSLWEVGLLLNLTVTHVHVVNSLNLQALKFVYRLRYLFNQTDYYSPLHRLAGH